MSIVDRINLYLKFSHSDESAIREGLLPPVQFLRYHCGVSCFEPTPSTHQFTKSI